MTNKNLPPASSHEPDDFYEAIRLEILQELLRQVRLTATVSITAIAGSALISLIGGGLVLTGKVPEGTVTTTMGLFSSMYCTQAAKDSNEKLEKIARELKIFRPSSEE